MLRIITFVQDEDGEALGEITEGTDARCVWRLMHRVMRVYHPGQPYRVIQERIGRPGCRASAP